MTLCDVGGKACSVDAAAVMHWDSQGSMLRLPEMMTITASMQANGSPLGPCTDLPSRYDVLHPQCRRRFVMRLMHMKKHELSKVRTRLLKGTARRDRIRFSQLC